MGCVDGLVNLAKSLAGRSTWHDSYLWASLRERRKVKGIGLGV